MGLGQIVSRWGAIDFGIQSGDVMHFDDRNGIGKPLFDAVDPAKVKVDAENNTAHEAFDKAAAEKGGEEKSGTPAPTLQRKASLGSSDDPLEREADEVADRVLRIDSPVRASLVSPRSKA